MATAARQPFAPLNGARLQSLTSLKNRQNAIPSNTPIKRKASEVVDAYDTENLDPSLFSKRAKGADSYSISKDHAKPSAFIPKSSSVPLLPLSSSSSSTTSNTSVAHGPPSSVSARVPRPVLQPRSPAARLIKGIRSTPLTAPAGRSPPRPANRRVGILSRRRTGRVDPPSFGPMARVSAPFSLDAALQGTISSYTSGSSRGSVIKDVLLAAEPEGALKASWDFTIHEDTPEQEMTNLLQHSTCVLDISSDEENKKRASLERAEGRDKENIPPADDVSQTTTSARGAAAARTGIQSAPSEDRMVVDKQRGPLVEMDAADYYPDGCNSETVILVPEDEDEADKNVPHENHGRPQLRKESEDNVFVASAPASYDSDSDDGAATIDAIMGKISAPAPAPLLATLTAAGDDSQDGFEPSENFDVWEAASARDPGSPEAVADVE